MVLLNQENRLLTGSADSELRAWDIDYLEEVNKQRSGHILTLQTSYSVKYVLNDSIGLRVGTYNRKDKAYNIILCELAAK